MKIIEIKNDYCYMTSHSPICLSSIIGRPKVGDILEDHYDWQGEYGHGDYVVAGWFKEFN